MRLFPSPSSRKSFRPGSCAFTITEMVIAVGLTLLGASALFVFCEGTGRTLVSLTSQSTHNQNAGFRMTQQFNGIPLIAFFYADHGYG